MTQDFVSKLTLTLCVKADTGFCVWRTSNGKPIYIPLPLWYDSTRKPCHKSGEGKENLMANRKDSRNRALYKGESERKAEGRYMYRYTDAKTGKQKSIYAKDLPELRAKEKALEHDLENNVRTDGNAKKLTVNDFFERYLDIKEISDSTKVNYRSAWENHVRDSIGQYKVVQVVPSDIKKLYSDLSKQGLARSSIKHIHNLLHPVLEMAVDDEIINRNPVKSVWSDYGREAEEKKALTLTQQRRLMQFLKSDSMYKCYCPMLTIMLGTGVRCGELVGLTWDDVDLEKKEIKIRRTLVYKDYGDGLKLHVSTPKTKSGVRTIPMSDSVYNAFTEQKELNTLLGRDRNEFEVEGLRNFVFITRNSRPLLMNSVNKILTNIVKAINAQEPEEPFPPVSAHTMRHTFCTRMAENGMDIKVLQHIMGHANINITMQVYNHIADSSRIEKELARINALVVDF